MFTQITQKDTSPPKLGISSIWMGKLENLSKVKYLQLKYKWRDNKWSKIGTEYRKGFAINEQEWLKAWMLLNTWEYLKIWWLALRINVSCFE